MRNYYTSQLETDIKLKEPRVGDVTILLEDGDDPHSVFVNVDIETVTGSKINTILRLTE